MIEKIMKAMKSNNKKRGRNITIGVAVGFLLSCTLAAGANNGKNYLIIKKDKGTTQFSTENESRLQSKNPYLEWNTWEDDVYTNNILLSGTTNDNGNGFGLKLIDVTGLGFINKGTIEGTTNEASKSAYGINIDNSTVTTLKNNGIIDAETSSDVVTTAYGINLSGGTIDKLENIGLINAISSGEGTSTGNSYGMNIDDSSTITSLDNTGIINGIGNYYGSGYGINIDNALVTTLNNEGLINGIGGGKGLNSGSGIKLGILQSKEMKILKNTGLINGSISGGTLTSYAYGINLSKGTIDKLDNIGIINGTSSGESTKSYGINIGNTSGGNITTLKNIGIISGNGNNDETYGIDLYNGNMQVLDNIGIISSNTSGGSYGINLGDTTVTYKGNITTLRNGGIISGNDNGYGMYITNGKVGTLENTGVIYGKDAAIKFGDNFDSREITTLNNYGILVTSQNSIIDKGWPKNRKIKSENNYGLYITKVGGEIEVEAGSVENPHVLAGYDAAENELFREMNIENNDNKSGKNPFNGKKENSILNAVTNTYKVTTNNDEVTGSIINAYGTAVVFNGDDTDLTLAGTIVNGGIDASKTIILGSGNADTLILQSGNITYTNGNNEIQDTIINGDIQMGDGNDTVTVGNGTIINGNMDGGYDTDILNFGMEVSSNGDFTVPETKEINILHDISNFENINVESGTDVTLYDKTIDSDGKLADLHVSGVNTINIEAGGILNLRIDSTKADTAGRYIGHALYDATRDEGKLEITGGMNQEKEKQTIDETDPHVDYNNIGVLNLITNGLSKNSIIAMNGITLNQSNLFVKTNSILDKAIVLNEKEEDALKGDIKIGAAKDLFTIDKIEDGGGSGGGTGTDSPTEDTQRYLKLNEIYKGIYSSADGNFIALKDILTLSKELQKKGDYTSVSDREQMSRLLSYLEKIYTASPYSYSSELSRRSMGMFRDIVIDNQFRPNVDKWLIMGGITNDADGGTTDTYYGRNYHKFDIGTSDTDADMKLVGAYMLAKYGYSENTSLGLTIGGARSEAELSMSKVKGNSGYVGVFAENYRGNLTLKAGAGAQYSKYDADRGTIRGYNYSDKYSDMAYDIYLNGRYSDSIGDNLFLEPYATLSYTYVDQKGADEGSGDLAIKTDSKSFDYTVGKVGIDLKKVIPHGKGKTTLSAGVSYTKILDGAEEGYITGRFEDGSDFDILVAHKNEDNVGINVKYNLELENGILFDIKGTYILEKDSHHNSSKNKTESEWIAGVGIGYKF